MELTELIEKVKQHDRQAFEELYNQYYPMGFSLSLQFVKNESDALDIMQDAFITVYSKLDSLEDTSKFKSWYMQIVANKCRDFLKKQNPLSFTDANAYDDEGALKFDIEETDRDFIPESAVDYSETVRIVDEMIAELPEEQRLCILLYFANDMKIPEIAKALQVSEATVKSRLKYGKDKIRAKTDEYQKKTGTKLYGLTGLSILPFMRWALSRMPQVTPNNSAEAFANIMNSVAESGKNVTSAIIQQATSAVSNTADKTAKAGNIFSSLTVTQKVVSGVIAGAIVVGSSVGIAKSIDNKNKVSPTSDKTSSIQINTQVQSQSRLPLQLEDFIEIEYSGSNKNGIASLNVNFSELDVVFDQNKIKDFLEGSNITNLSPSVSSLMEFTISKSESLSNGDTLTITISPTKSLQDAEKSIEDIAEFFNLDFNTQMKFTVEGLGEFQEIDIFSMIKDYIIYEGPNGNAFAYFDFPDNYRKAVSDRISLEFSSAEVTVFVDGASIGTIDISLIAPNPKVEIENNLEFIFEENGPLTNGEMLTIELGDYYLSEILKKLNPLGYTIENLTYELEVEGL